MKTILKNISVILFGIFTFSFIGCDDSAPPAEIIKVEAIATPNPGSGQVSFKVNLGVLPEKPAPANGYLKKKSKATAEELDAMEYAWRQNQIKSIKLSFEPLGVTSVWLYFQFEFKKNELGEWEASGTVDLPAKKYNIYSDQMHSVYSSIYYAEPTSVTIIEGQNQTVNLDFYMQDYVYVQAIIKNPIGYYTIGENYDVSFVGSYVGEGFSNSSAAYLDAQGMLNFDFYAYRPWNNGPIVASINGTDHTLNFQIEDVFNSTEGNIYLQYTPTDSVDSTIVFDDPPITCEILFDENGLPCFQCYQAGQTRRFGLNNSVHIDQKRFNFLEAKGALYEKGIILYIRDDLATGGNTLCALRIEEGGRIKYCDIQNFHSEKSDHGYYSVPLLIRAVDTQRVVLVLATRTPCVLNPGIASYHSYYLEESYFNNGFLREKYWSLSKDGFDALFVSKIIIQTAPNLTISVTDLGITWYPEMSP